MTLVRKNEIRRTLLFFLCQEPRNEKSMHLSKLKLLVYFSLLRDIQPKNSTQEPHYTFLNKTKQNGTNTQSNVGKVCQVNANKFFFFQ
jgi:hypothetical protein